MIIQTMHIDAVINPAPFKARPGGSRRLAPMPHPHVLALHVGPLLEEDRQRISDVLFVAVYRGGIDVPVAAAQRVQHGVFALPERRLPHAETEAGHLSAVVESDALLADCPSCHGAAAAKTHAWWQRARFAAAASVAGWQIVSRVERLEKAAAMAAAAKIGSNAAVFATNGSSSDTQCVFWCPAETRTKR